MEELKTKQKGTLIIANPGTGKTTMLANKVIELIKRGVSPKDILCITFTTKAAQEMRKRIIDKLKESGIKLDSPIEVHTFHSYANDYLQEHIGELEVISNNALRFSIYKSLKAEKALYYSEEYIISDIVPKIENAIRYIKSFGILPDEIDMAKAEALVRKIYNEEKISNISEEENVKFLYYFKKAFEDYERFKGNRFIDYNDMLIKFIKHYDKSKRHYKYVLVDELQDVNTLEAEIAIKSGDELFLVGDRKQAIFGFQGGSTRNFRVFENSGLAILTLGKNYRSAQRILDYSKAHFIKHVKDKADYKEIEELISGIDGGEVSIVYSEKPENAAVMLAMREDSSNTAIITRTNDQLLKISRILDSKGIDYASTINNAISENAKNEIIRFVRGLLYDDWSSVLAALATPFSGTRLIEAMRAAELADNSTELERLAPNFLKIKSSINSLNDLQNVFNNIIIPISASIGKDYFVTALAISNSITEFFEVFEKGTREDLLNYLALTEEEYEPIERQSKLVLTTAHKAKGLEFDNVIYVPKVPRERFSFIDAVVYAIVMATRGIDIRDELEEEEFRIDFVAFTRAKKSLKIVVDKKLLNRYSIEDLSDIDELPADSEPEPLSRRYDEAYALFINGRYEDALKLINKKEPWLYEIVYNYFSKLDSISFSLVDNSKDAYSFMKNNILGITKLSKQLEIGSKVHKMAELLFKGTLDLSSLSEEERNYLKNIIAIRDEIENRLNAKQLAAEEHLSESIEKLFGIKEDLTFKGSIDAVYLCSDGSYAIIDYKTDKSKDHENDHRRQLLIYRKLYSKVKDIDEAKIRMFIAYVGLSGKINTGTLKSELVEVKPSERLEKTFIERLNKLLEYKKDPDIFIEELKSCKSDEILLSMLKQGL
ncbi:MAG: ATP-dependent DNA helicase Rep [Candidatus Micrarchaeota archaeon]|nr:MAG: ATP-dependent DNA helicase Rep [Candidatus Micrarchaeota archaeon]